MTVWRQCCTAYKHSLIKHGPSVKKKHWNNDDVFFLVNLESTKYAFALFSLLIFSMQLICLMEINCYRPFVYCCKKFGNSKNFWNSSKNRDNDELSIFCKLDEETDTSTFVNQLQLRLFKPNCLLWSQTRKKCVASETSQAVIE